MRVRIDWERGVCSGVSGQGRGGDGVVSLW